MTRATPLRSTPPFTELVVNAVRDWQFFPAREAVNAAPARAGEPTPEWRFSPTCSSPQ